MRRSKPQVLVTCQLALLCAVGALTSSCTWSPQSKAPVAAKASWARASADEGRQLFLAVCAGCHGEDGSGRSRAAHAMFPPPRDLTQGEYRFRSTASGTVPLRTDLLRTLTFGLPGTAMPSWGEQLSGQQLMSVVLYVASLSPRFRDESFLPEADDIYVNADTLAVPPETPALRERGHQIYVEMKCGDCHGARGRGDGPAAKTLKNQDGSKSHVFDFTYGIFKGGTSRMDVYRTFLTGLDGTPMPSYYHSLPTEEDRWALVYHCLSLARDRGLWFYLSERPTWQDPFTIGQGAPRRVEGTSEEIESYGSADDDDDDDGDADADDDDADGDGDGDAADADAPSGAADGGPSGQGSSGPAGAPTNEPTPAPAPGGTAGTGTDEPAPKSPPPVKQPKAPAKVPAGGGGND